ncbi:unnamed protein product [Bursaphelenchus xylophilus]|uniref:Kinesin-like protein n=1 Tax=Bursaphelenchus xylophilus TaxID=6326 RepID=A0A1I7S036_BURXY|nr:unnamed protein product [Bursaphelenchus xylophilus]CAG9109044.1 unnamed protein product [Bursaphelenchus xylophilus]
MTNTAVNSPTGSSSSVSSVEPSSSTEAKRRKDVNPPRRGRQVYPLRKNSLGGSSSQLVVAVRIRPLNESEKQKKGFECAYALDQQKVLLVDPEKFENNILRQNRQHERTFNFDAVFGPGSEHMEVHEATTSPLVDFVVAGSNATVFAYGPTGSGKTYTMVGTPEKPGLMTLLTRALYQKLTKEDTVYISFLEIYNEVIKDLLNPGAGALDLLEDEKGNVLVPGLSRVKAPNTTKIMQILQEGNSRRTQEPTAANKSSSRSHALLQVTLYKKQVQHGKLFLIDLAGSERASQTQNQGQRLKEGAAINRSLLALGNVINALSTNNKGRYVNYRDSKLTRLLKDSLGGNSKTIMLAHVTPASLNYDETYNTLVYANRARNITTRITYNRPVSADQAYSEAMKDIRKQAADRNGMIHAESSHQISEKGLTTKAANIDGHGPNNRRFANLFHSLKAQYFSTVEKLTKLRERLMKINHEAVDLEMNVSAKRAILDAWENRTKDDEDKYSETVERIKKDMGEQETRLSSLHDTRQKSERLIRKNQDILDGIEARMRGQAKDADQNEMVNLLVRMAEREAEKVALASDAALKNLKIRRQENSLLKVQKYGQIADKLISANLSDEERQKLQAEYRIIKTQLNYHLIPLKVKDNLTSWNSQLLDKNLSNNKPVKRVRLPEIPTSASTTSSEQGEKRSSVGALPAIQT